MGGLSHWRPVLLSGLVFATVVAVVLNVRDASSTPATTTTTTVADTATTLAPSVDPTTAFALERTVKLGMRGEDVARIQQRLKNLAFDPGPVDGIYGWKTIMAVWAFQALVMDRPRDSIFDYVTPQTWEAMRAPVEILPRRTETTDTHVEIYLPEQVMITFTDDKPILVTHISSGDGLDWCEEVVVDPGEEGNPTDQPITKGICGRSETPGGVYAFYSRKLGLRNAELGTMWNPVYFNQGIAIHGALSVPNYPASHGCIRIPIFISEYFHALVEYSDRVFVFDGVKEPEEYGSQRPYANRPWPGYTTTTGSTTTTTTKPPRTPRTTTTTIEGFVPG